MAKYQGFEGRVTVAYAGAAQVKQTKKEIEVIVEKELRGCDHSNFRGCGTQDDINPMRWTAKNDDRGQQWLWRLLDAEDQLKFAPFVRTLVERKALNALLEDEGQCSKLIEIASRKEDAIAIDTDVAAMIEERHGAVPEACLDNWYEAKQAAKAERYQEYADNADACSTAAWERSHAETKHIPFGQPILVGHHSERKHRNALSKSWNLMGKSVEEQRKADYFRERAATVGSGGISSDDPDAIRKLQLQLFPLMTSQLLMKEANKLIKSKTQKIEVKLEGLAKLGFSPSQIVKAFSPDFCGRIAFAGYSLSNNSANIRRINDRIDQLKANAGREDKEYELIKGYLSVEESAADNRIYLYFPGKPPEAERQIVKSNGFRWNRTQGAWSRQLNNRAVWMAEHVAKQIQKMR